jgi:hypothetical protein
MKIKWIGAPSEAPAQKRAFEAGTEYEVSDESGRAWIAAGVAEAGVRVARKQAVESAERE